MGRLSTELKERVESFCDRMITAARALEADRSLYRVVDQIMGCGTSVGANVFEADEAMSSADFIKCLCIALKELNESIFWIRLVGRNGWVPRARLADLEAEAVELKKVFGSMVRRTISKRKSGAHKLG